MTAALNVIAIAGSSYRPSRTLVLAVERAAPLLLSRTTTLQKIA